MEKEKHQGLKKGKYVHVPEAKYRKYRRRDSQILRVKVLIREAWRVLQQVE